MPDQETPTVGRASAGKQAPLLVINRVVYKKVTANITSGTHETLGKYQSFFHQANGLKPEESEVIEAALKRAFEDDKAFQSYLANGGGARESRRQPAHNEGVVKGGGQG